jgi:hypothetical protein
MKNVLRNGKEKCFTGNVFGTRDDARCLLPSLSHMHWLGLASINLFVFMIKVMRVFQRLPYYVGMGGPDAG